MGMRSLLSHTRAGGAAGAAASLQPGLPDVSYLKETPSSPALPHLCKTLESPPNLS